MLGLRVPLLLCTLSCLACAAAPPQEPALAANPEAPAASHSAVFSTPSARSKSPPPDACAEQRATIESDTERVLALLPAAPKREVNTQTLAPAGDEPVRMNVSPVSNHYVLLCAAEDVALLTPSLPLPRWLADVQKKSTDTCFRVVAAYNHKHEALGFSGGKCVGLITIVEPVERLVQAQRRAEAAKSRKETIALCGAELFASCEAKGCRATQRQRCPGGVRPRPGDPPLGSYCVCECGETQAQGICPPAM